MRRTYLTPTRLAVLADGLSDHDRAVLATFAIVRVASAAQVARLHCGRYSDASRTRQCTRMLSSLVDRQLLSRLDRRIGGVRSGSNGFIYCLGPAGQRLLTQTARKGAWTPGLPFLKHTLAITELLVELRESVSAGRLELLHFETEPACWRRFAGAAGRVVLKPDAFVTTADGDFENRWFVEVDRSTESTTALSRKLDTYRRYWQAGVEQAAHGLFPAVLWVVLDERRHAAVIDTIGRQPAETWPLHRVALTGDAIAATT